MSKNIKKLKVGDVIEFIDAKGRKGVICIKEILLGYKGQITIDVKVQEKY